MILPNVRASFGSDEVETLLGALGQRTRDARDYWDERLADEGLDSLLDHDQTLSALLEGGGLAPNSPKLLFYVMVRHTLLESGLDDPELADYVASLLIEFTVHGRSRQIAHYDDKTYEYVVDIVANIEDESSERRQFLLRAHLGNYSLWLSGLFPDYVAARVLRKGAPGIEYYEDLGSTGYRLASESELADRYDLANIYRDVAGGFRAVRLALNRVSDRYFFPSTSSPVNRFLRQILADLKSD